MAQATTGKEAEVMPWMWVKIMRRLRALKEECEQKESTEPVSKFFEELNNYVERAENRKDAEESYRRVHQMWDKHYDRWFTEFCGDDDYPF
jgi:hypothetical protein